MYRLFEIEILVCPDCGAARRLLAAIHDPGTGVFLGPVDRIDEADRWIAYLVAAP